MKRDAPPLFNQCGGDVPHRDIPEQRDQSSGAARGLGSEPPSGARAPPHQKRKEKMRERKNEKKEKKERKKRKERKKERKRKKEKKKEEVRMRRGYKHWRFSHLIKKLVNGDVSRRLLQRLWFISVIE